MSVRNALLQKIDQAIAALNEVPDVPADNVFTRAYVKALQDANLRAWIILTDGRDPPSQRSKTT